MKTKINKIKAWQMQRENLTGWAFVAPALIGFLFFFFIPILTGVYFSFTDFNGFNLDLMKFVGMDNYVQMFSDEYFVNALKNNMIYALLFTPLTLLAALFFATALNYVKAGRRFFRVCYFLPYITAMASVAVIWKQIFNPTNGPLNLLLMGIGISDPPKWLMSSDWALFSTVVVSVWKNFGYYMLILLAGMQTIPDFLHEAAKIDGASAFQRYRKITLPLLSPTIFLCIVMLLINSFQVFDLVNVLTKGGPGYATQVVVYRIYTEAFTRSHMGYASAIAYFLSLMVLVITAIQFIGQKYWVH